MSGGAVLFGYHTFGARALAGLLSRGERVRAVVTHGDVPGEGDWFESVADLARAHDIPVFTLFAILFFFVGLQILALGLIGEYVGRIYQEVRRRPRYVVRETLS